MNGILQILLRVLHAYCLFKCQISWIFSWKNKNSGLFFFFQFDHCFHLSLRSGQSYCPDLKNMAFQKIFFLNYPGFQCIVFMLLLKVMKCKNMKTKHSCRKKQISQDNYFWTLVTWVYIILRTIFNISKSLEIKALKFNVFSDVPDLCNGIFNFIPTI